MFGKQKWDNSKLIAALLSKGREFDLAYKELESVNGPKIQAFVRQFGGSREDAKELLQDGITALWKNIVKGVFKAQSSIHTYLYSICKRIWCASLRKLAKIEYRETYEKLERELDAELIDFETPEYLLLNEEQKQVLKRLFEEISENCCKVLEMWSMKLSMKEIAEALGYKTEAVAMNKKNSCLKDLEKKIDVKPHIQKLIEEMGWKKYPRK